MAARRPSGFTSKTVGSVSGDDLGQDGRLLVVMKFGLVPAAAERLAGVHRGGRRVAAVPDVQLGRVRGRGGSPHGQAHHRHEVG